jgi:cell division protein FtsQ
MNRKRFENAREIYSSKRAIGKKFVKKRAKRRHLALRRFGVVLFVSVMVSALFSGIYFPIKIFFKVKDIELCGDTRYNSQEVIETSGLKIDTNLFFCDTKSAKEKIEKKFPYIETAEVERQLPNKLAIKIREAVPFTLVERKPPAENPQNLEYALISPSGRVLECADQKTEGIPIVKGLETGEVSLCSKLVYKDSNLAETFNTLTDLLQKHELTKVSEIDLSDTNAINLKYQDRIDVRLGTKEDLSYKISTAAHIIKNKVEGETGTLDLSSVSKEGKSYFNPNVDKDDH